MSTLRRYRKSGGFKQLLDLVETSPAAKKEQLLKIIAQEDSNWAQALEKRMLTAKKIFHWPPENIDKVLQFVPEQTWPKALFFLPENERFQLFQNLIQFQPKNKQNVLITFYKTLAPSAGEVDAAQLYIIKKVRELQLSGDFRPERWDPDLATDQLDKLVI